MLRKSDGNDRERTARGLAAALEAKDQYTGAHNRRVARFAARIALEMGLAPGAVEEARIAGALHDIGKIGVPDQVLQKPAPLDDAEWITMRQHPELGYQMIAQIPHMARIADALRFHHERPDGKGYPMGLFRDEIPLLARIISVADAFDAMTTDRPYRMAMEAESALEELKRGRGTQFQEQVVDAFERTLRAADAPPASSHTATGERSPFAAVNGSYS